MSASPWASQSDRRPRSARRSHRRPRQRSIPVEIETQKQTTTTTTRSSSPTNRKNDHDASLRLLWEQSSLLGERHCHERRVEILPGSLLIPGGEPWLHPPEPEEPPPVPTEIVQLLILGQENAGKTTLVQRFLKMHCQHAISTNDNKCFLQSKKGMVATKAAEQTTSWSVTYHKKDVTFWHRQNSSAAAISSASRDNHDCASTCPGVGCARVQLWDVTGGGPPLSSPSSNNNNNGQPLLLDRRQEWIRLVQKMSAILLVVSLEHGPDVLMDSIVAWKQWLDESCPSHCQQVHLILQKSDLLPQGQATNPFVWIELGARLSRLCDSLGICAWKMTTCHYSTDCYSSDQSPEEVIINVVKRLVTTTAVIAVPQKKVVSFKRKDPTESLH